MTKQGSAHSQSKQSGGVGGDSQPSGRREAAEGESGFRAQGRGRGEAAAAERLEQGWGRGIISRASQDSDTPTLLPVNCRESGGG